MKLAHPPINNGKHADMLGLLSPCSAGALEADFGGTRCSQNQPASSRPAVSSHKQLAAAQLLALLQVGPSKVLKFAFKY